ncbi:MAG TPA: hypothetical protein VGH98_16725 [Gemmatimonadaceae bacterium]|jgi:hypothetical protein
MMRRWLPRRPSPTFKDLGAILGEPIDAPDRRAAERLAIFRYGRPIMVEMLARTGAQTATESGEPRR